MAIGTTARHAILPSTRFGTRETELMRSRASLDGNEKIRNGSTRFIGETVKEGEMNTECSNVKDIFVANTD